MELKSVRLSRGPRSRTGHRVQTTSFASTYKQHRKGTFDLGNTSKRSRLRQPGLSYTSACRYLPNSVVVNRSHGAENTLSHLTQIFRTTISWTYFVERVSSVNVIGAELRDVLKSEISPLLRFWF